MTTTSKLLGVLALLALLPVAQAGAPTATTAQTDEEGEPATAAPRESGNVAYAPYWYVDDLTESFIEVNNFGGLQLILLPVLRTLSGESVRLPLLTIAPFSSERIGVKNHLRLRSHRTQDRNASNLVRWGDGSIANSFVGSAELITVSPQPPDSAPFSARIIAESLPRHLVFVSSMFQFPTQPRSNSLEGLWWFPHPTATVYFALQNLTPLGMDVRVDLFTNGTIAKSTNVKLASSSTALLNIAQLLGPDRAVASGGIRLVLQRHAKSNLQTFFARGIIVHEDTGFASPLILREPIAHADAVGSYELHGIALLGDLSKLLPRAEASSRPQLLLRNTSLREIEVQPLLYGRDSLDTPTDFRLERLRIPPEGVTRIDLQAALRKADAPIENGFVGLRLLYNGSPTALIGELVNIDANGHTILYDSMRNPFFHRARVQVAISFRITDERQTLVVLKNMTDTPQEARVLLQFDRGRRQYDVRLAPVDPQQIAIVDLKQLRDRQIEDREGVVLPRDILSGSVTIFSRSGGFVTSDPTFVPAKESRAIIDGFSCTAEPSGGGGSPPTTPMGACCLAPGCSITTRLLCNAQGGAYFGDGTIECKKSLGSCSLPSVSVLGATAVPRTTACDRDACGETTIVPSDVNVDVHAYFANCAIHFFVNATLKVEVGPCLENIVAIGGNGDPGVTSANFCKLVTGLWNDGNLGGTCIPVGPDDPLPSGLSFANPQCVLAHEGQHFKDFAALLSTKNSLLSTFASMAPMPFTGQTCAEAIAARRTAIRADVKLIYEDASASLGEASAAAAARPCQVETARAICKWARDEPFVDVDLCTVCSDGSLGVVFTDPE